MNKISIITPFKNSSDKFIETYRSVINQTFIDFEWIIIDDASSHKEFKNLSDIVTDSRVTIYKNSFEKGAGGARNFGITKINGQYLTFIDSDDSWELIFLERMMDVIKSSKGIIFSGYKRFDCRKGAYLSNFVPTNLPITNKNILKGNPISCLTTFIDISKFDSIPFFGNFTARNDLVFFYRLLGKIEYALPLNEVLATYNIMSNSISRNKLRALKYQWLVCRNIANLSIIISVYNCICWMSYGIRKYYIN